MLELGPSFGDEGFHALGLVFGGEHQAEQVGFKPQAAGQVLDAFIPDLDRGVMDMAESIAVRLLWGAGDEGG